MISDYNDVYVLDCIRNAEHLLAPNQKEYVE